MIVEFSVEEIVKAQSDPESLNRLIEKARPWFYSVAYRMVNRFQIAEDVAQEVSIRVFNNIKTLNNPMLFKSWSYFIIRNAAFSMIRKKSHTEFLDLHEKPYIQKYECEDKEDVDVLINKIRKLPLIYKEVIMAYHVNNSTYKELSVKLKRSIKDVEVILVRGRKILSRRLGVTYVRGRKRDPALR